MQVFYDRYLYDKPAVNKEAIIFSSNLHSNFRWVYYYRYSADGSLKGYVNNSLTYINISDLEPESLPENPFKNLNYSLPYCRYKAPPKVVNQTLLLAYKQLTSR